MTTTVRPDRQALLDGQGDVLGPVATFGAQVYVAVGFIFAFQVTGFEFFPGPTPYALAAGAFLVLALTPRAVLMRLPVSLLVFAMIGWMAASVLWTDSPEGTSLVLQRELPLLLGFVFIVGVISLKDLVAALVWAVRFSVLFTVAVLAVYPETRLHIDPEGNIPELAGWHGYFPHKNIMTPFLIFGLLTTLTFDRTKVFRWVTVGLSLVLVVGSDSITGIAACLFALTVWVWLQLYRNLDIRNSSIFVVSSISVGLFGILGIVASLSTLTSASGRDVTFTGRTFIWAAVWDALSERPLLGYGLGGILGTEPVTSTSAEVWRAIGFQVAHAHSGFLDLAIQLGVVGLVIFGLLYLTTMSLGLSLLRDQPKVAAWIVSTLVVQLFISLSENVFIGSGWLTVMITFRVLLMRKKGMELSTGVDLAERLRRHDPVARRT